MLVIGAVFVDVKGFAREKYMPLERNVGDVQVVAGGVCRNVAENLTLLGVPSRFVSMVDDNGLGAQVRDGLAALGFRQVIRPELRSGLVASALYQLNNMKSPYWTRRAIWPGPSPASRTFPRWRPICARTATPSWPPPTAWCWNST